MTHRSLKRAPILGIASALLIAATVSARADAAASDVTLTLHIPALEGTADVTTANVVLNWTDHTSNSYSLPSHTVVPNGNLNANGDVNPPNRVLESVYAFGTDKNGATYARSASASYVGNNTYTLFVAGIPEGQIIITQDPF
ncbi:MAG TPA: hypothetical protein VG389_17490 [Myxococcota bacterium]|jgi:hypothetical protein|nr:hypothetical protein [Myxococcota bacterium]